MISSTRTTGLGLLIFFSFSCTDPKSADAVIKPEFNRFIIARGMTFDPKVKLEEFAKLPEPGNVYDFEFQIAESYGWKVIRVDDELSNYYFTNLAYWMLGYGEDDQFAAEESMILLTSDSKLEYLGIMDPALTQKEDRFLLMSASGLSYIIDVPSHEVVEVARGSYGRNVPALFADVKAQLDRSDSLQKENLVIRFNEKTGRAVDN